MDISLATILGGIVVVLLIAVAVYVMLRKSSNTDKLAKEFLDGFAETITESIVDIIKGFKPDEFSSLEEFETAVLNKIYDDIWDYVDSEAKIAYKNNTIVSAVLSILTKDMVIKYVDQLIESINAKETIANKFAEANIAKMDIESEDKALDEKFSDQSEYVESVDTIELDKAILDQPSAEQVASLNPPTDEEESFNIEDDSQEIVSDTPVIVTSTDKNGKTIYYEVTDGKKKRVTKDYALSHM